MIIQVPYECFDYVGTIYQICILLRGKCRYGTSYLAYESYEASSHTSLLALLSLYRPDS